MIIIYKLSSNTDFSNDNNNCSFGSNNPSDIVISDQDLKE